MCFGQDVGHLLVSSAVFVCFLISFLGCHFATLSGFSTKSNAKETKTLRIHQMKYQHCVGNLAKVVDP